MWRARIQPGAKQRNVVITRRCEGEFCLKMQLTRMLRKFIVLLNRNLCQRACKYRVSTNTFIARRRPRQEEK